MADWSFDIDEDLVLHGVRLNIPPFLHGKEQLTEKVLIITVHGQIQDFSRGGAKLPDIIIWVVICNTIDRKIFAVV